MTEEPTTAKATARKWWRDRIAEGDDINLAKEAKVAATTMRANAGFCEAFLDEFLEPTMHEMGQRIMAISRASLRTSSGLREQIARDTTEEVKSRWQKWMQFEPESGIYMPLVNMDKSKLLNAADYMDEKSVEMAVEARFLRLVAAKVPTNKSVGDVLTDDDLDTLRSSLKSNVTKMRKAA